MSSTRRRIYLDNNATRPMLPAARSALVDALEIEGNPSSVHEEGRKARAMVEAARVSVAELIGGRPANVVFTAGATEAAVTCLSPRWLRNGSEVHIEALAMPDTDHPATREGGQFSLSATTRLPVDAAGIVSFEALATWLDGVGDERTGMLAVCLANNETGVIQPIGRIVDVLRGRNVLLVVDAVQAAGRLPVSIETIGADAVILSGHKLGAAKGVGAFVLRDEVVRPFRLVSGGGQEKGMRSGTEAVPAIASFGAAARAMALQPASDARFGELRARIVSHLEAAGCEFAILGLHAPRLANTLAIAVPNLRAETAQIALDLQGFAVSAGSACSSGKVGPSHVLAAQVSGGLAVDPALGFIRVSFGDQTTEADVDAFADAFGKLIRRAQDAARSLEAA